MKFELKHTTMTVCTKCVNYFSCCFSRRTGLNQINGVWQAKRSEEVISDFEQRHSYWL